MPLHENVPLLADTALWVALVMAAFAILFGTRHIDAAEHHEGMVAAIAFESLVKLVAFLAVGLFVTFGDTEGFAALFNPSDAMESVCTSYVTHSAGTSLT